MEKPFIYRLCFLWIEPLSAHFGVLVNLFTPLTFLQSLSPLATATTLSPLEKPIYDQLAAHLFLSPWMQMVVLRSTSDIQVWERILLGMFLCDVLHLWASYSILGARVYFNPTAWRWEEWVNFAALYGFGSIRLALSAGIGLGRGEKLAQICQREPKDRV
jgi:hypothetical protein